MSSPCARAAMRGGAADDVVATRRAGDRDHDTLACLPRAGDAVRLAVLLERLVDAIGDPHQRELAQRAEVALPEEVGERRVDLLGRVDVAVGHPPPERLRRHVDQLDLIRLAHDGVGDRLVLLDPRDLLDDVVHRLEVLHVHGGDDVDAGVEQLVDVLPALRVPRARARWCARARRPARARACGPGSRRRPSPRT